jgi:hypothetical protein
MNEEDISKIKMEIDYLKEYLENEICKKCKELSSRLKECEDLLYEYSRPDRKTQA